MYEYKSRVFDEILRSLYKLHQRLGEQVHKKCFKILEFI